MSNKKLEDTKGDEQILEEPRILYTKYLQMCMLRKITKRKLRNKLLDLDTNLCNVLKQDSKLMLECENTRNCIEQLKNKQIETEIMNAIESFTTTPEAEHLAELLETPLTDSVCKLESLTNDLVLKNVNFSSDEQEEFATYLRSLVSNLRVLEEFFENVRAEKSEQCVCDVVKKSKQFVANFDKFLSLLKTLEGLLVVSSGLDIYKNMFLNESLD